MKVAITDTNGNDYGEYGGSVDVNSVEIYMPALIVETSDKQGMHGVTITTYGTPFITETPIGAVLDLVIREAKPIQDYISYQSDKCVE